MSNKFDELAKGLALSVTRLQALKRFSVGLAGMALACFGLADKALSDAGNGCYNKCFKACYDQCIGSSTSPIVATLCNNECQRCWFQCHPI